MPTAGHRVSTRRYSVMMYIRLEAQECCIRPTAVRGSQARVPFARTPTVTGVSASDVFPTPNCH